MSKTTENDEIRISYKEYEFLVLKERSGWQVVELNSRNYLGGNFESKQDAVSWTKFYLSEVIASEKGVSRRVIEKFIEKITNE